MNIAIKRILAGLLITIIATDCSASSPSAHFDGVDEVEMPLTGRSSRRRPTTFHKGDCATNCVSGNWVDKRLGQVLPEVLACRWTQLIYAANSVREMRVSIELEDIACKDAIAILLSHAGLELRRVWTTTVNKNTKAKKKTSVLAVVPIASRGGRLVILKPKNLKFGELGFGASYDRGHGDASTARSAQEPRKAPAQSAKQRLKADATRNRSEKCHYGDHPPCVFGDSPEQMEANRRAAEERERETAQQRQLQRFAQCMANCSITSCSYAQTAYNCCLLYCSRQ